MGDGGSTFDLGWLNSLLLEASSVSRTGFKLKASGERCAAASMRAALELHEALQDETHRSSFDSAMGAVLTNPLVSMPEFVRSVPFMLDAESFSAPNGMFDIPSIFSTVYFVRRSGPSVDMRQIVERHRTLVRYFCAVLIKVQVGFLDSSIETNREAFIQSLEDVETFDMPESLKLRYEETGKDLLPSLASVIAVLGGDPMATVVGNAKFHRFVAAVDTDMWLRSGSTKIWPEGHEKPEDEMMVRYLWHARIFLSDAADRLALAVLTCDRVPIVAPWYAMLILSARAYAMSLYAAVSKQAPDPVKFTAFSLVAMAVGDPAEKLPAPTSTLFNAGTKNMYQRSEGQDGPYWALLRATLSGISPVQARDVARMLVAVNDTNPSVFTTTAMLCALMRTQTGMIIFSYKPNDALERVVDKLEAYPFASKAALMVDAVRGQNVFDFVTCTMSATLDLEMLASDDLAFMTPQRIVAAWRDGCGAADAIATDAPRMDIVNGWLAAMAAVGAHWVQRLNEGIQPAPQVFNASVRSITATEMKDSLDRAAASQASTNHGQWLALCFKLACMIEETQSLPLITTNINLATGGALGTDITADNAWLRLNFRYQTEQVLHSGRMGGLFTPGNHLVLVAWVVVPMERPDDNGIRVFSRAITSHTVATASQLLSDKWYKAIERRGDDSIVATAIEFERALHDRNVAEKEKNWPARERVRKKALGEASKAVSGPSLPMMYTSSRASQLAGAIVEGVDKFNGVTSLDDVTTSALFRFRKATGDRLLADSILICQTPFEQGLSLALIASPATTNEDTRPACDAQLGVPEFITSEKSRLDLLSKLRKFQGSIKK